MSDARVLSEPRTYGPDATHSFFQDQALAFHDPDARRRLDAHVLEVAAEVEARSREGVRAEREYQIHYRSARPDVSQRQLNREIRAANSSSIAGFSTPQWIIDEWAPFRGTGRTFADQCRKMPLPSVGLQVNVPRFTSGASAGVQAEGAAVIELDPAGADQTENLQTIAGQLTASQQVLDRSRSAPNGPTFDLVMFEQLRLAYNTSLNNYVLGKAMGAGPQVAGQSTFSLANFYQDVAAAREKLQDTNGVRLQPSHLFSTPDLYSFCTRQLDGNQRPLIVPGYAPGQPVFATAEDHDGWDQFTGTILPGVLMWFVDATIPAAGSNTQFIVSRPDTICLWESEPVTRAFPQTLANDLQVVAQFYAYAACVPRYPGATVTVTGSGYPTSNN